MEPHCYGCNYRYPELKRSEIILNPPSLVELHDLPLGETVVHEVLHLLIPDTDRSKNEQLETALNVLAEELWRHWQYEKWDQ